MKTAGKLKVGVKNDSHKPDMSLLSSIWLFGVARVLTFGKRKYAADNWRKGLEMRRLLAAALRHIFLFMQGHDLDIEGGCKGCRFGVCTEHTGLPHLDCASCMLMFARELWVTRPDLDDRYKGEQTDYDPNILHKTLRSKKKKARR